MYVSTSAGLSERTVYRTTDYYSATLVIKDPSNEYGGGIELSFDEEKELDRIVNELINLKVEWMTQKAKDKAEEEAAV